MRNINVRLLIGALSLVSIITFLNSIILYWVPIIIPFSSFAAVRLVVLAFIEKHYWLILLSLLVCVLLFLTTVSVYRRHILLPILSLTYLIYEFIVVLFQLIDGLGDGYWKMYIVQTVVTTTIIVLLCTYCWSYFQKKFKNM